MKRLALVLLFACGSKGTPQGPVGSVEDLRKHLKPEVAAKAPADDKAVAKDVVFDLHGATCRLVWHTFDDGSNKYLLSVGLEVTKPASGVTVEAEPAMNPMNAGTESAVIEKIPLKVKWTEGRSWGEQSWEISADGSAKKL
jgi:hypothetical protein